MKKIIRLTESELSSLIKMVLLEGDGIKPISAPTPIEFFKLVKTKTKGKRIDLSSINVVMSENGGCSLTYKISQTSKPVMILIPYSEESDMGSCPACDKVRQLNPNIQIVKVNGKDLGTFGKNRKFQIIAVPVKTKTKKPATKYSSKAVGMLQSAKAEDFRGQIYDDKCPNRPYPSVNDRRTCGGNLTIGYGTLINGKPELKKYLKGSKNFLTKQKAAKYLIRHLDDKVIPQIKKIEVPLNQNQFDATSVFLYNIGSIGVNLLDAINSENIKNIKKYWLQYTYQDGQYKPGLLKRRQEELKLFFTPVA